MIITIAWILFASVLIGHPFVFFKTDPIIFMGLMGQLGKWLAPFIISLWLTIPACWAWNNCVIILSKYISLPFMTFLQIFSLILLFEIVANLSLIKGLIVSMGEAISAKLAK